MCGGHERLLRIFYARFKAAYADVQAEGGRNPAQAVAAAYDKFFAKEQADVAHYFSQLHDVLEFVHASDVAEKSFYAGLLRGQLSTFELAVLFYHCLSDREASLKTRVEQFAMLRALPQATLIQPQHAEFYQAAAFGPADA